MGPGRRADAPLRERRRSTSVRRLARAPCRRPPRQGGAGRMVGARRRRRRLRTRSLRVVQEGASHLLRGLAAGRDCRDAPGSGRGCQREPVRRAHAPPRRARAGEIVSTDETVRVACQQIAPVVGDLEGNRRLTSEAIAEAVAVGAQVVVLPELATSGYVFDSAEEARSCAEPPDGPTLRSWSHALGGSDAVAIGGFCELAEE